MTDLNELFKVIAEGKKHYEETDPVGKKIKEAKDHVKEDLSGLFAQLISLKEDLEKELVVEEAKLEPPMITEEIPAQSVIHTPEVRAKQVDADVDKYLTDKSFQQPNPDLVTKNIDDIRNKIKFLEQAIGRVAAAGPGGGEVNLRYLDDVDRSTITDGWYLRYSATKKKFEFAEVISTGGNGATGPAGATGPGGGDTGATGITGSSGAQGASGLNGSTGPTGASGAAGINGATGTQGASGSVGASGVYTSTETLDSVTTRGNTTDNEITVRAVNIPNGATGASGINNIVSAQSAIIANISNEELNAVVEYGNSAALDIGDYGLPFGITGVPYVVYELKATPSPALQVDDVVGGAYIPVGSKLLYVGSGTYSKIIITDKNFASGALLPVQNTVLVFARETVNQGLSILTPANTDITINPGAGGHIVPHADIIPYTTNEWSLGSPAKRFKEVWLGTGTIYVQDETLGNDQALGAKDGNFYIKGGAGFEVGEWTLRDNTLQIKDSTRDVFIGQLGATADVVFNRSIKVQDSSNRTSFKTDRTGRTQFYPPSIPAGDIGGVSIIGSTGGAYQPVVNAGGMLHITGNDGAVSRITNDAWGTGAFPAYISRAGRGTAQAPSASQSGDILSRYSTVGWGATGFAAGLAPNNIEVIARENFTNTEQGAEYKFYNAPIGSTAKTLDLTINTEGLSFSNTSATTGITFYDSTRLTYFPIQVGQDGKYLKVTNVGGQDLMSWEPVAAAGSGATGAQGASGVNGATGINGASGVQGASGTNGTNGATGTSGTNGIDGATGSAGTNGATGSQGASGATGISGTNGTNGATGIQGASGSQGASGATGISGTNGTNGATGIQGASGVNGSTGAQGIQGASGSTGLTGATGVGGSTGAQGASGIGATGLQGASGATGTQGASGIQGASGSTGLQGASGATGLTGAQGLSNSVFYYSAKTNSQNDTVYPSDGYIIWNNSTQINSSILSVPHITVSGGGGQGGTDIDVILSLVQLGQQIIIQDQDESGNYQTWTVSSTPTVRTSGTDIWYNFPITLVTSSGTGTSNFSNNSGIVLIIATNAPGATGIRGATGLTGATGATPATAVLKTTGSWTVTAGAGTYSFTVPPNGTYQLWVNGNIPNGIVAYNATVTVTNTNVPVVGNQYAWYYLAGNALVFTSIPSQVVGTNNTIITTIAGGTTSNVFTFGITNNSGTSQTVNYGYTTIS